MTELIGRLKLNTNPGGGLRLDCRMKGCLADLTLTNTAGTSCRVGDLTLFTADMPFVPDTKVYGEGYSKLAQYGGTVADCRMTASYSDYTHYRLKKPDDMHQVYNMAVFSPDWCSCR